MGCGTSTDASAEPPPVQGISRNPSQNKQEQQKKSIENNDGRVRVILVGPGESGKSTILKQMKILEAHEKGKSACWTEEELLINRPLVYSNAVGQMRLLVQLAFKFEVSFSNEDIAKVAREFCNEPQESLKPEDPDLGKVMQRLWAEPALRVMYTERDHLYNLNDGASYFWDALERIYSPSYAPTEQDLLRVRLRTAMADEVTFPYKGSTISVTDLGGQLQERAKWGEHITTASTLLFVSSLCEFDQKLREQPSKIRMVDTLELFEQLLGAVSPHQTIVVLLNKFDLFSEKMRTNKSKEHFQAFFSEYRGPIVPQSCAEHIKSRFLALGKKHKVRLHIHMITAIETNSIRLLWHGIREILVEETLKEIMLS